MSRPTALSPKPLTATTLGFAPAQVPIKMLFPTCSFCSRSASSSYSDVKQSSVAQINGWASELFGRVLEFGDNPAHFIETLLPCSKPFKLEGSLDNAFSTYKPAKGAAEVESYPDLIKGLKTIMKPFKAAKKSVVVDTHLVRMDFPFDAFATHHHHTYPDICIGFPGKRKFESNSWQEVALVIEAKGDERDDPFPRRGFRNIRTVEQLAKNARNLMLANGFLYSFVIGIYGHTVRLVRFDHTCALVSKPIDLRYGGAKVLQRFLWHFVHPAVGDTVVGCDPTISRLDDASQEWLKAHLEQASVQNWKDHVRELKKGRRVEVFDDKTGRCIPYLLYHLVDVNGRLFSRATMVWRAIEDTRIWKDGRLVDDPARSRVLPKPRIVKEAWRQLVRTAEATFYDRISARIPDEDRFGLPTMVCGGDIGEFECRWWEDTERRYRSGHRGSSSESFTNLNSDDAKDKTEALPSAPTSALFFSSTGSATVPQVSSVQPGADYIPPYEYPTRYPQHQTYSWRLVHDQEDWHRERSHMRIVIDDVGRPLTEFASTHELVLAVRDAIKGHRLLWEKAKILHRDVSVGNILIADDQEGKDFVGFLHDFDYSAMECEPQAPADDSPMDGTSEAGDTSSSTTEHGSGDPDALKERTGTFYFMAYEILSTPDIVHNTHHDLESFYWVLLWVVVRHTDHGDVRGQKLCDRIFKYGDDEESANAKKGWLEKATFNIPNNAPLTYLLTELTALVQENLPTTRRNAKQTLLTYQALLSVFDSALAMPGWPTDDWRPCTLLKGDGRTGIAPIMKPAPPNLFSEPLRPLRPLPKRGDAASLLLGRLLPSHNMHPGRSAPAGYGPLTRSTREKRSGACLDNHEGGKDASSPTPSGAVRKKQKVSAMGPPTAPGRRRVTAGHRAREESASRYPQTRTRENRAPEPTRSSARIRERKTP
ncbi:hypothetical protein C8Q78DRAFT_436711 [Trametes maxima]|nr:hypothetical protein C8Q78DRAFT_436711 [Trametes maxima]